MLHEVQEVFGVVELRDKSLDAADHGLGEDPVLRAARELYASLSSLAHGTAVDGAAALPAELFAAWGKESLVAYAAVVSFSGRRVAFYGEVKEVLVPLKLRSLRETKATAEAVLASALL